MTEREERTERGCAGQEQGDVTNEVRQDEMKKKDRSLGEQKMHRKRKIKNNRSIVSEGRMAGLIQT